MSGDAVAKQQVRVCDECGAVTGGANGEVRAFIIVFDDGRLKPDLCEVHAQPLYLMRDAVKNSFVPTGERGVRKFQVVDEVPAAAKRTTKRTVKRAAKK